MSSTYSPRSYQINGPRAIRSGKYDRYCGVLHRRAGKDRTWWNFTVEEAMRIVGVYFYFLPTYSQAKKVIWDATTLQGHRFLDDIPDNVVAAKHDSELKITFVNGSIIQLIASDSVERSIVGTNPIGCVFSEYSICSPKGWDYISPILAENKGWASFIFTPRRHNHGYKLFTMAKQHPSWFCELLTVEDTRRDAESDRLPDQYGRVRYGEPVVPKDVVESERASGKPEAFIQQEYYCSFEAFLAGTYFGEYVERLRQGNRIRRVMHEPSLPVNTAWDLGVNDSCAIWFFQLYGNEIRIIEYYEHRGEGLPFYAQLIRGKTHYLYETHLAPWDIEIRDFSTGISRKETAIKLGLNFVTVPRLSKADQRDAARVVLPRCYFDEEECEPGLSYLGEHHAKHDEDKGLYSDQPERDHTKHAADAFMILACGINLVGELPQLSEFATMDFNPIGMRV
jgi:phage terminase large subunit